MRASVCTFVCTNKKRASGEPSETLVFPAPPAGLEPAAL